MHYSHEGQRYCHDLAGPLVPNYARYSAVMADPTVC